MPRTAATRRSERATPFGRPSASQPESVEGAPVLFRLPWIKDPSVAKDEVLEPNPTAPVMANDLASGQNLESMAPAAEVRKPEATSESDAKVDQSPTKADEGSWWEHWSSGIVLILLIIALVTASIIAFNENSSPQPEYLADDTFTEADLSELENIDIPDLDLVGQGEEFNPSESAESLVVDVDVAAPTGGLQMDASAAASDDSTGVATKQATGDLVLEQASTVAGDGQTLQESAAAGDDSLQLTAASSAATTSETDESLSSVALPAAQDASLGSPVGNVNPPLFPELPEQPSAGTAQVSTTPSGASPSFYDGATVPSPGDTPQVAAQSPTPEVPSLDHSPGGVSYPALPTETHKSMIPASTVAHQSESATTSAPETQPVSAPMVTATPDADAEQLIKTYQQFRAMSQGTPGAANRYQQAPVNR